MEKSTQSVNSLNRKEGNSLKENYELHDVGSEKFFELVDSWNQQRKVNFFDIEETGIDKRDSDSDTLIYDDTMDYLVTNCQPIQESENHKATPLLWIDVKTKSSEDWMNIINLRHYSHYVAHNTETDENAYLFMCLLNDDQTAVENAHFIEIEETDISFEYEDYFDPNESSIIDSYGECVDDFSHVKSAFTAPDYNPVVSFTDDSIISIEDFESEVLGL